MITIYLIEDHLLIREVWKDLLSKTEDYKVIGESGHADEAYEEISKLKPDIILTDINLKGESASALIKKLCNTIAKPKIIVVSVNNEYSFIKKMFAVGVKGYVTKFAQKHNLLESIKKVYDGETYMCDDVKRILLDKAVTNSKEDTHTLSMREIDIIKLIAKGLSNKQIADSLNISIKTIEGHKTKIGIRDLKT